MTSIELLIEMIKEHEAKQFTLVDIAGSSYKKYSPGFTVLCKTGCLTKIKFGVYEKSPIMINKPTKELVDIWRKYHSDYYRNKRAQSGIIKPRRSRLDNDGFGKKEKENEHDLINVYDILDQLKVEDLFTVLSLKFDELNTKLLPLQHEVKRLKDLIGIREGTINSLEVELNRLKDKQRILNSESDKYKKLFNENKADKMLMVRPLNRQGTAVFRDPNNKNVIKVYRKIK